jgi:hypothetical protein
MMRSHVLLGLFLVAAITVTAASDNNDMMNSSPAVPAPREVINLDLPAIERWKVIATKYKSGWAPVMV